VSQAETDRIIIQQVNALAGELGMLNPLSEDEAAELAAELQADLKYRSQFTLALAGYDELFTTWGRDDETGCLYARLWHDIDDDPPDGPPSIVMPSSRWPATTDIRVLAEQISSATGHSLRAVLLGMEGDNGCDDSEDEDPYTGTTVTITEGYTLPEWPYRPNTP